MTDDEYNAKAIQGGLLLWGALAALLTLAALGSLQLRCQHKSHTAVEVSGE